MLVDPLSNFYLYYSLEKNDGTAVSERRIPAVVKKIRSFLKKMTSFF